MGTLNSKHCGMRLTRATLACASLLLLIGIIIMDAYPSGVGSVPATWKTPGMQWRVKVRQYSRAYALDYGDPEVAVEAQKLKVQYEFEMIITVLDPQISDAQQIARLQFTPSEDAPAVIRQHEYVLEIDLATGRVQTLKSVKSKYPGFFTIIRAEDQLFLVTELLGFPVDWIVEATDLATLNNVAARTIRLVQSQAEVDKILKPTTIESNKVAVQIEAGHPAHDALGPSRHVIQTWVPGESWWRSFKRYYGDRLDLEAIRITGSK